MSLPPSQPDVTDYNERSMTLRWRPPIDDGGMKITAYNIEAKTQVLCIVLLYYCVLLYDCREGTGRSGSAWTLLPPR